MLGGDFEEVGSVEEVGGEFERMWGREEMVRRVLNLRYIEI